MAVNMFGFFKVDWREFLAASIIIIGIMNYNSNSDSNDASYFLKNIDATLDPCDNFYKFACGKLSKFSVFFDSDNKIGMFDKTLTEMASEMVNLIKEEVKPDDIDAFRKMKIHFQNCMYSDREEGVRFLLETLDKAGGWPVLYGNDWQIGSQTWLDVVYKMMDLGYPAQFPVKIDVGMNNIITLSKPLINIQKSFFVDNEDGKIIQAYYEYILDVAVMLGADKVTAAKEVKQILNFELNLYFIFSLDSSTTFNLKIAELSAFYPNIPWLKLINRQISSSGINVNEQELLQLNKTDYLESLVNRITRTPDRVIVNFLMWQIISDSIEYLPEAFLERKHVLSQLVTGETERQSQAGICVYDLFNNFPIIMNALYVRKMSYKPYDLEAMQQIFSNIKRQFRIMLEEAGCIDEQTKRSALEKIDAMNVSSSKELLDDRKLNDYYKNLEIQRGSYIESKFNISLFISSHKYSKLRKLVDNKDWTVIENVIVFSPSYCHNTNTLKIPVHFLRGPFYNSQRPHYLNYGALGLILGHEITHGFDFTGKNFDKNGNEVDWWQPFARAMYDQRAKCIIDQYANFTIEEIGMKINGYQTLDENIADNGGLRAAYRAYVDWSEKHGPETDSKKLGYNERQLFWITAASIWCSKPENEKLRKTLKDDCHSPSEARVVLPISNMKEFARDFNCPLGSRMNPIDKCIMW